MRIGVITDVHNNVIALQTMLEHFKNCKVDCICCCGDIIGIGPFPDEIVQDMMKIDNLYCVYGNHEEYFMKKNYEMMRQEEAMFHKWEHERLSNVSQQWIYHLPKRMDLELNGIRCSIMHYGYENGFKPMLQNPNGEQLEQLFSNCDSQIVLYGHMHSPSVVKHNERWFVNVGSLGCPQDSKNIARGGVVTIEDVISVELVEIPYDINQVLNHMEKVNCPAIGTIQSIFYGR